MVTTSRLPRTPIGSFTRKYNEKRETEGGSVTVHDFYLALRVSFIYTNRFDAQVEVTTTSIRNGTEGGVNSAGTIATTKTKLYDMDDKQIGVGQWVKFVTVSALLRICFYFPIHSALVFLFFFVNSPHLFHVLCIPQGDEEGFAGSLTSLFTLMYEFGTIADGYFDSSITAMVAADRLPTEANQRDYDAVITGGTGKAIWYSNAIFAHIT